MSAKRKSSLSPHDNAFKKLKHATSSIVELSATSEMQTIYVNEAKTSWIKLVKIAPPHALSMSEFEELWRLKPSEKLQIKLAGKVIACPRYTKSYLQAYTFSGLEHEADMNMPERIKSIFLFL